MENKDIELRSEQVRKIIGQIPPVLIRSGIGIIGIIVGLLLAAAAFIPYPETVESEITLSEVHDGQALAIGELPYPYISQIKTDMKAEIELEGYTSREYSYQQGHIVSIIPEPINRDGQNYFQFTLSLKEIPFMQQNMKGKASIILSEKTLLKRIFK